MNKEELISWFNNKFNSCYYVKHEDYPESLFMFYDIQTIRNIKLAKLLGKPCNIIKIKGKCIFEQNYKNKHLYCDYDEIWSVLSNYYKYYDIQSFINERLLDYDKMNVLIPFTSKMTNDFLLLDHDKMNVLTPVSSDWSSYFKLLDLTKMSVL